MKTKKLAVSQKRLRALAMRALRVVERQQGLDVNVAAIAATLVPAAGEYIRVYDEVTRRQTAQNKEMGDGRDTIVELHRRLRGCLAILRSVSPQFDPSGLLGDLEHPDQLIVDGHQVTTALIEAGSAVPGEVVEALRAAVDKAEQAWTAAQTARVEMQKSQEQVRLSAMIFNRTLIALRRTLRAHLGSSHLDYQTLRSSRVTPVNGADDEEEVVSDDHVEVAPTVTAPAPANKSSNGATNGSATLSNAAVA